MLLVEASYSVGGPSLPTTPLDELLPQLERVMGRGTPLQSRPWNTSANSDAIRHFTAGISETNPLWIDAEYAAQSVHKGLTAPPSFLLSTSYPVPRIVVDGVPLSTLIVEIAFQWFQPLRIGEEVRGQSRIVDIGRSPTRSSSDGILVRTETAYSSGLKGCIARATATSLNFFPTEEVRELDGEARLDLSIAEDRSSAMTPPGRTDDDPHPGDVLFSVLRGPMGVEDRLRWAAAIGPVDSVRPVIHLHTGGEASTGDSWEVSAERRTSPRYDSGAMRFACVSSLLTDWLADAGTLKRLRVLVEAQNRFGDITRYTAAVVKVSQSDGGTLAAVTVKGVNQSGVINTTAHAELWLRRQQHRESTIQSSPAASIRIGETAETQRSELQTTGDRRSQPLQNILAACAAHPGKTAILSTGSNLTYTELLAAADRLARKLLHSGVASNDIVAICLPRSPGFIVAILGVVRAGAAYLALDPEYPPARLTAMAESANLVLCDSSTLARVRDLRCDFLDIDSLAALPSDAGIPLPALNDDDLAYLMFTSGSTGKPRAAEITHQALNAYLSSLEGLGYSDKDVCLHSASFSFSASVRQLFAPLAAGATIVLASAEQARDPQSRLLLMKQYAITVWDTTPSALAQTAAFLESRHAGVLLKNQVERVLLTGEPLRWSVLSRMRAWFPSIAFVNLYSQTETSGSVCAYRVPHGPPPAGEIVPSGTPLPGNEVSLLDDNLREITAGAHGDIYIRSDRLARGYRDNPAETAKSFLSDVPSLNGRWYRTGDRGYLDSGGQLVVTGRRDAVVNVRGVRVTLAEVEATIARVAAVKEVMVTDVEDESSGTKSLVAFVATNVAPVGFGELRAQIYRAMPAHMRPGKLLFLQNLPRLPNNKIDRQQLRTAAASAASELEEQAATPAQESCNAVELDLLEIVRLESGVRLALDEPIVNSGMDSLGAIRLAAAIEEKFHKQLTLTSIYQASTVRALAAKMSPELPDELSTVVHLYGSGERTPLFFIPGQNSHPYDFLRIATLLGGAQPSYGLQYARQAMPTFESIAEHFAKYIRQAYPSGPYMLAGHSLGGRVAFEIAKQLQASGKSVAALILLDSSAPTVDRRGRTLRALRVSARTSSRLRDWYRQGGMSGSLRKKLRKTFGLPPTRQYVATASWEQLAAIVKADARYRPAPFDGAVTLLRATIPHPASTGPFGVGAYYGWERLAQRGVRIVEIPGDHISCMREPHVEATARQLDRVLKQVHTEIDAANSARA